MTEWNPIPEEELLRAEIEMLHTTVAALKAENAALRHAQAHSGASR